MFLEQGRFGRPPPWAAVAFVLAATAPAGAADAAGGPQGRAVDGPDHPLLVAAKAGQCARLLPTGGREVIVNICNACRVVNIIRKRPGNAVPVSRSYNVQPKSTFPVPFRGPGRSRITSELPCKGDPGAARNLLDPEPAGKKTDACVELEPAQAGGVVLVNGCRACKAVLVERQNGQGRPLGRQAYEVAAKTAVAVPSDGAQRVGVVAEVDCQRP